MGDHMVKIEGPFRPKHDDVQAGTVQERERPAWLDAGYPPGGLMAWWWLVAGRTRTFRQVPRPPVTPD